MKLTKFQTKIKKFEFIIILPKIYLKENNKKLVNKKDNENILIKLPILIMIKVDKKNLFTNYKFFDNKIDITKFEIREQKYLLLMS